MFGEERVLLLACIATASLSVLPAGCARRQPLPTSHAQSANDSEPSGIDPRQDDPVRVEIRGLHVACDETIAALQRGVDDAERRENILTAVAALAYVVGEIADGADPEGGMYGPSGPLSYRCTETADGHHEGPGCGPQPVPSRSAGEGGPIDQQTDEIHQSAAAQVRQINEGLDAVDELLFSNPDPATWGEGERGRYRELQGALSAACAE